MVKRDKMTKYTCAKCGYTADSKKYRWATRDPERTAKFDVIYHHCPKAPKEEKE